MDHAWQEASCFWLRGIVPNSWTEPPEAKTQKQSHYTVTSLLVHGTEQEPVTVFVDEAACMVMTLGSVDVGLGGPK